MQSIYYFLRTVLRKYLIKPCMHCIHFQSVMHNYVNPRGLHPNALWQMDAPHVFPFGKVQFVHISVDTYTLICLCPCSHREAPKHSTAHCFVTFAVVSHPWCFRKDNALAYTNSHAQHKTISQHEHSSQPKKQAIIWRYHSCLKQQSEKQKWGEFSTLTNSLSIVLLTLNFKILQEDKFTSVEWHWSPKDRELIPRVLWKYVIVGK